ncbi:MAG: phage major capsid protein [Acidimicrobiia bacterium]|nr:phage major capsid protein [Acidimicrobiia bacterium]
MEGVRSEYERLATPDTLTEVDRRERETLAQFFTPRSSVTALNVDLRAATAAQNAWRDGARGDEFRVVMGDGGSSGGSLTIPSLVASEIVGYLTASTAMRRMRTTQITTEGGHPYTIPTVTTHGIATQVATQDTAFAGSDPVLGKVTLNAYDAGQLAVISGDLLEDAGPDMASWLGSNIARAVGEYTSAWFVNGSGSGEPQGVMTAISGAGTIATGGSLIDPSIEKLLDLVYSVPDSYRARGAEFLMRDQTAGVLRKIRDGAGGTVGAYVWSPSSTAGQPDQLLGHRAYTDGSVASLASNAKVVAFGDFSCYWLRDVGGLRLERSDDLLFNKRQVAFRGLLRTDGRVVDAAGLNIMKRSV